MGNSQTECVFSEKARVGGTLIWYYSICPREVWLMARGVEPDRDDEYLVFGRLIDQNSYAREKHQIVFGDSKLDFIHDNKGTLLVAEVKKSSRTEHASTLQVAHYLYELRKAGIEATGVLLVPSEKKRTEIILTPGLIAELEWMYEKIEEITTQNVPPPIKRIKFCGKCAYSEYCWS